MGVFSFTCAKTNLPIISFGNPRVAGKHLNEVVYFPGPEAMPVKGSLGEYGQLYTRDAVIDLGQGQAARALDDGTAKLAIIGFLTPGDTYAMLGRSHSDPGQGGLTYAEGFVEEAVRAGGFATYEGLCLAFHNDVPIALASRIGPEAMGALRRVGDLARGGYEEAFLARLPGSPAAGNPGEIGRFSAIEAKPLDVRAERVALVLGFGDDRKKVVVTRVGEGYEPDPVALGREVALTMPGHSSERVATFERDGDEVGKVTVFEDPKGRTTYVTDVGEGPVAYVHLTEALRPFGHDLLYPISLWDADREAHEFFDDYGDKPASGRFEAPAVNAPHP